MGNLSREHMVERLRGHVTMRKHVCTALVKVFFLDCINCYSIYMSSGVMEWQLHKRAIVGVSLCIGFGSGEHSSLISCSAPTITL